MAQQHFGRKLTVFFGLSVFVCFSLCLCLFVATCLLLQISARRVRVVRTRGGNQKLRALRLETGNFSWGSEVCTRKTRIMEVVYNASNNELVRTNTLVKGAIVSIDAAPFRQWYATHYGELLTNKTVEMKKGTKTHEAKVARHRRNHALDPALADQIKSGRLLASIASRPGQSGKADGYILEGAVRYNFSFLCCVSLCSLFFCCLVYNAAINVSFTFDAYVMFYSISLQELAFIQKKLIKVCVLFWFWISFFSFAFVF